MATTKELADKADRLEKWLRPQVDEDTRTVVVLINRTGFGLATNCPKPILVRMLEEVLKRAKREVQPEGLIIRPPDPGENLQ